MEKSRIFVYSFSLILMVSLVFPAVNSYFITPAYIKVLVEESEDEALRLASHIEHTLKLSKADLQKGVIPPAVESELTGIKKEFNLYKLNIFDDSGKIIYTTDPRLVGYITYKDFFKRSIADGKPYVEYIKKGDGSLEDVIVNADVVEAYVPILREGKFAGAFEIYYDITGSKEEFVELTRLFSIILFAISGALITGIIALLYKISSIAAKQQQTAEELVAEKIKSEAVMAAMAEGISIQDTDFRVLYQNEAHRRLIGGDKKGEFCYRAYQKRNSVCEPCHLAQSYIDGGIHRAETMRKTPEGDKFYEIIACPLKDANGKVFAGIELVREVTERKRLEEQLRHAQKMEAIGTLTGGISHEFNNIMTSILGFGELLQEGTQEGTLLRKYADMIVSSAGRAAHLTQGLLAFSRKQLTQRSPVSIKEIVMSVEGIITRHIGENISLRLSLPESPIIILADSNQIQQVLINLSTNAKDAMPEGGVLTIKAEKTHLTEQQLVNRSGIRPGDYLMVSVSDTGTGMDDQTITKIFEPFFTTKDVGKGTGLGLSMVHGIIEKHDGFIDVKSSPGQGTTFTIYLPVYRPNPAVATV